MKKMVRLPTWWAEAKQLLEHSAGRLRTEVARDFGFAADSGDEAARVVERVWRVRKSQWTRTIHD